MMFDLPILDVPVCPNCGGHLDFSPSDVYCLSCWEAIADGDYTPSEDGWGYAIPEEE